MADYQQVVDNVRAFLGSFDQTQSAELAELATAYASLCREANDRLRRCSDYLRRGLRSEAIHFAEAHPHLLDMVAALDLPELPDWEAICATYDLARPPRLAMEAAQELNEAYAAEQPLEALLAENRLLALAREPLRERIAVMRELASLDAGNPVWDEDLETFEAARLAELRREASVAVKAADAARVWALLAEADDPRWRAEVPADVRETLRVAGGQLRSRDGERGLRDLLPAIDTAYSAMAYDECRELVEQWDRIVVEYQVEVPAELREKVQPVMDWVGAQAEHRERERQAKVDWFRLAQLIEQKRPVAELDSQHAAAAAHGLPVPAELEVRYRRAVDEAELVRRRRLRRNFAIAGCLLVAVAAGVAVLTYRGVRSGQAQEWASRIDRLLSENNVEQAEQAWNEMVAATPSFAERGEMDRTRDRLSDARRKEAQRAAGFRLHMDIAARRGLTQGETTDLDAADKLIRTDAERREYVALKERVDAVSQATQQSRDEAFAKQVDDLAVRVRGLETTPSGASQPDAEYEKALTSAVTTAAQLGRTSGIGPDARASLAPVTERLSALRAGFDQRSAEARALQLVISSAGSSETLTAALKAYGAAAPNTARAVSFAQATAAAPAWAAIEQWHKTTSAWSGGVLPKTPEEASSRLAAVRSYRLKFPTSPYATLASLIEGYIAQGQLACAADGPWRGTLTSLLRSPLIRNVDSIRTTDGRTYYVVGPAGSSSAGVAYDVATTNDLRKTVRKSFRANQLDGERGPSAQSKLAARIDGLLEHLGPGNWECLGLDAFRTVRDDPDIDPVLKVILAGRILQATKDVGWELDASVDAALTVTAGLDAEDVAWMNPENAAATAARTRATELVQKLPDLAALRQSVAEKRNHLQASLATPLAGAGVLLRERAGSVVRSPVPTVGGLEAWVPSAPRPGAAPVLVRLGSATADGKWSLRQDVADSLPEGAMVFLFKGAGQ